jgi:hypothetical protein
MSFFLLISSLDEIYQSIKSSTDDVKTGSSLNNT